MQMPRDLALVVPLYNEESRTELLKAGLDEFLRENDLSVQIILVDDGSSDGTSGQLDLLTDWLRARYPCVSVDCLKLPDNVGKGGALKRGVGYANARWALTLDADIATHPLEIFKWRSAGLWEPSEENSQSICIGSREHPDSVVYDHSSRRMMGRVFNTLVQLLHNTSIRDTQCGFKLYPMSLARRIFALQKDSGWAHDVELLDHARRFGAEVVELPIVWRAIDESKVRPFYDAARMFWSLLKLRLVQFWCWFLGADKRIALPQGELLANRLAILAVAFLCGIGIYSLFCQADSCQDSSLIWSLVIGAAGASRIGTFLGGRFWGGLGVASLLLVGPTFLGDSPRPLFWSLVLWLMYYSLRLCKEFPHTSRGSLLKLTFALALACCLYFIGAE